MEQARKIIRSSTDFGPTVIIRSSTDFEPTVYEQSNTVAIDTETNGLNLHRDRLCLVQMCFGNDKCYLLQIEQGKKYPNFVKMLRNKKIEKIFHYGRFDIAMLHQHFRTLVGGPVFCTKIASKMARTYSDKHGLKNLCRELLNVELNKDQQSSDWGAIELSEKQEQYAASDVIYLHRLKDALTEILLREDRLDLAEQSFRFLPYMALLDCFGWDDIFAWGDARKSF